MAGNGRSIFASRARNRSPADTEKKEDVSEQEIRVEDCHVEFDSHEAKRIARKIDYRLLPMLTILYILSFIDRSNIGNAKVAGMNEELNLTGHQYNMALTVFFFPYCLFEVPSNIVLKLTKPSRWIMVLVLSWGTVMTLQGLVKSYEHLIVTRFFLGMTEAGFFPAATFLVTTWYCRWQLQTRMAIFYSAASLAGSFSGLLAFGIQHMDGVGGLGGWRWIFILEGILTVVCGCLVPWTLPDTLEDASFLTEQEKAFIKLQMQREQGVSGTEEAGTKDGVDWGSIKDALTDWKIYLAVVMYWGNCISTYGFNFSAPTIIHQLGYSSTQAQLLTVPPYFVGSCSTLLFAYLSDKYRRRWVFIVIPFSIALVGYTALLAIPHPRLPGLTYFFLFWITAGLYASIIGTVSWVGNNLAPAFKRAVGMAVLMTVGNLGGTVGSNIFLEEQAPHYWLGYGLSLGIIVAAIVSTVVLRVVTQRLNKSRDRISADEVREQYSEGDLLAMGDKSPLFRYVS